MFLDRVAARTGDGGCRSGKHTDWPAASRYDADADPAATAERQQQFRADTSPTPDLRPVRRPP